MNYRAIYFLAFFLVLAGFLWKGLYLNPNYVPSELIHNKVPGFNVATVENVNNSISDDIFKGRISILNVWNTSCPACISEHKTFALISQFIQQDANSSNLQLIGFNLNDQLEDANFWLQNQGNPYKLSLFDQRGKLSFDFGISGTPETFLIDQNKVIRLRHQGPINSEIWEHVFKTEINKIQRET